VEATQHKRSKGLIAVGIVLVLIIGGLAGYFLYYKKTPTYSFELIRESMEKHDWETFNAHVDTDSVLSSGFDALFEASMSNNEIDENTKKMASGFAKMLKPTIILALKDDIKKFIETGSAGSDVQGDTTKNKKNKNASVEGLKKSTDLKDTKFKGIAYTKKADKGIATVGIILTDNDLGKDFTLDIKMRQLKDGTWQIIELSNLKEYIKEVEQARNAKAAELNQPM